MTQVTGVGFKPCLMPPCLATAATAVLLLLRCSLLWGTIAVASSLDTCERVCGGEHTVQLLAAVLQASHDRSIKPGPTCPRTPSMHGADFISYICRWC